MESHVPNRQFIEANLQALGCSVEYVDSDTKAITMLTSKEYDVCLMDREMSGKDGLKAIRTIRKKIGNELVLIAVTAFAKTEDKEKCLNAGIDDCLSKSVTSNQLKETIRYWVKKKNKKHKVSTIRKLGIDDIDDVSWGSHLCNLYKTKEDLRAIAVSYFKTGLENNEFCMWITSEAFTKEEAIKAMQATMPDFDAYRNRGQIEIVPYAEWHILDGTFDGQRMLDAYIDKLAQALEKGHDGMRIMGNTDWIKEEFHEDLFYYEQQVNKILEKHPMLVMCNYKFPDHSDPRVVDGIYCHQCTITREGGKTRVIARAASA